MEIRTELGKSHQLSSRNVKSTLSCGSPHTIVAVQRHKLDSPHAPLHPLDVLSLGFAGQLVQSLNGPADGQDPLLSLFSVFNCLGRVFFGSFPEMALHRWGTPRSALLSAPLDG